MNQAVPARLTIAALREAYRQGRLTPEMVVDEVIRRAEADREKNIWIVPPSQALLAPYVKRLKGRSFEELPLWGIPFAIKDNIDLAGVLTTAACPDYAYVPERHATVVERLLAAGALPIGKANLDQFATGLVGMRSPYGETHNALREELISGGSSSGSAVAVACGQAAFALGTDTAGSGRVPAALNGLVGLKPAIGAWSTSGVVPACASLDCVTVFAHLWEDALAVDRVVRGVDEADPWSRPLPSAAQAPGMAEVVYIPAALPKFFGPYAEQYQAAWEETVEALRRTFRTVEPVDCALLEEAAALLYEGPWIAERWAALGAFVEQQSGSLHPVTEKVLRSGGSGGNVGTGDSGDSRGSVKDSGGGTGGTGSSNGSGGTGGFDAAALFGAMHRLQVLKKQVRRLLRGGVLVMPTCGGTWTREQVRAQPIATNSALGRYTNHCNLLDLCAAAVPAGEAANAVPFGITWFAPAELEGALLDAVRQWTGGGASRRSDAHGVPSVAAEVSGASGMSRMSSESTMSGMSRAHDAQPIATEESGVMGGVADATDAALQEPVTLVAVCGLHMRGYPLEQQMKTCGARFVREARTAPKYRMVKLRTSPAKPGLIKELAGGRSQQLELWEMPLGAFGGFAASIPAPLGIGKVELEDGAEVPGFVCEAYAALDADDITAFGGWRFIG